MGAETIFNFLFLSVAFLFSISFHEAGHAFSAKILGDDTAEKAGRLTLNPFAHLDIFGTIAVFIFHFGWGKPVPVDPDNFKNKKTDIIIVSLAGPMMNFILGFFAILLAVTIFRISPQFWSESLIIRSFLEIFLQINIFLGVFNLLPFFPLDGGNIVLNLIPRKFFRIAIFWQENSPIIFFIILGIQIFYDIPLFSRILFPIVEKIIILFQFLVGF